MRLLKKHLMGVMLLFAVLGLSAGEVKRGRNEGTLNTNASNVLGNGNINLYTLLNGNYDSDFGITPIIGGQIGVGGIMQFQAQASFNEFREIGPAEAHLQITMPGNDRLRFFGIGIKGDLYLSTSLDSISLSADSSKPENSAFIKAECIMDFDFFSKFKNVPLKLYVSAGLTDDPGYLYRYKQVSVKYGLEWKMYSHSIFLDGGVGFYKENANKINTVGDDNYEQRYVWLEPGGRYRIRNRFSLLAGIRFNVYHDLKKNDGLLPNLLRVTVKFEAPVYFKETNAEAIRTLVYMDKKKETGGKKTSKGIGTNDLSESKNFIMEGIGRETGELSFESEEKELSKRREEIQSKMDEIERLLEETE